MTWRRNAPLPERPAAFTMGVSPEPMEKLMHKDPATQGMLQGALATFAQVLASLINDLPESRRQALTDMLQEIGEQSGETDFEDGRAGAARLIGSYLA